MMQCDKCGGEIARSVENTGYDTTGKSHDKPLPRLGTPTETYRPIKNGLRIFFVMMEPNIADPAWIMPVSELKQGKYLSTAKWPDDYISYSTPDELVKVAGELRDNFRAVAERREGMKQVLRDLGMTENEYMAKMIEKRRADEKAHQDQLAAFADEGNPHHD